MRLTKIICTLGPATFHDEGIRTLAERGMNIARMNFSHGSQEDHKGVIKRIRTMNAKQGKTVGLLLDTKGAEIRTGDRAEPLVVKEGETVVFTSRGTDKKLPVITVNYPDFWRDAKDAHYILVDNGEIIFDAVEIKRDRVVAKARGAGSIGSRRHVNLPGADVSLPSVTEKDWTDIKLACTEKLDYIALSFVRNAKEINEVRAFAKKNGHPDIQLIAKIENAVAVRNIAEIVEASDGVMVARGDLGSEIPLETVPAVQDEIVARCREAGKPVIVATHMLESMIKNPLPTRAEVTDIAHAAVTGADSTMLSGETAAGKHPAEALTIMGSILEETEKRLPFVAPSCVGSTENEAHAAAAVSMAQALRAPAIVVFTKSGNIARAVSKLRPTVPVIAFTDSADVARRMQILYGVQPVFLKFDKAPEKTLARAFETLRGGFKLKKNDRVVVLSTILQNGQSVHTVQSRLVP